MCSFLDTDIDPSFHVYFQAFDGNVDQHNVVTNWFNQRFRARYVRIKPRLYSSPTNTICLRAELYGCVTGKTI